MCSCFQSGLKCVAACGDCRGVFCRNIFEMNIENDIENIRNIFHTFEQ